MVKLKHLLLLIGLCPGLPAMSLAAEAPKTPAPFMLPADFYPESIDVTADGTFYIGSWRHGAIARLLPGQDKAEVLVPPGSNDLTNTQGVLVDKARGLLWACSGNMGYTTVPRHRSALKAFDLASGAPKQSYDLPGGGYCNDLALARDGRIFVTDSLHPRILVLDDEKALLRPWIEDPQFCRGTLGFCLNGIAIDPDGSVYASLVEASPDLLRIGTDVQGKPAGVTPVHFPRVLKNADGLRSIAPGRLLIFESNAFAKNDPLDGSVTLATIRGNGAGALQTLVNGLADPSSGIAFGGRVYFIQSKYSILLRQQPDDTSKVSTDVPFVVDSVPLPVAP
jgi:hypothetical protein